MCWLFDLAQVLVIIFVCHSNSVIYTPELNELLLHEDLSDAQDMGI